jgi:arginase family enzyme
VSLDLDSIASAHAPGVSAPQPQGLTASEAIEMMEISGADPKVASLGIFELNPEHDADGATSRLAAECVYYFVEAALTRRA